MESGMIFPAIRRNFFEPMFLWKLGSSKLSYWRRLEKTQYLSRQELEEIQWRRLQELWDFIWQHNQFYRNRFLAAGLTRESLAIPQDITKLPIITKQEIRAHTEAMISDGYCEGNLLHFKTGGSTGKALDIFITEKCSEQRNACARRHDRWTGWEPGEPIGVVWGNPKLPVTFREKIQDRLVQPYIYLDTMAVTEQSVRDFADSWKRVGPTLLYGHAHSLFILACFVEQLGLAEIAPEGILSTSMMLLSHERKVIEKVFSCKVIDRYGCEEVSLIGCECERHDGMHLNTEHLVIEFLREDGMQVNPGEPGQIVVTDLMNRAMPFVRYLVEDVGVPLNRQCPCGRGLPLMGKVEGRVADFLEKPDGTRIAGISLIENTLTRIPGIDQMQIIQEKIDSITLNVVPGLQFNEQRKEELSMYFRELFDGKAFIHVMVVDEILPEKSGKYRFSICLV